jgi:hypothetical protein
MSLNAKANYCASSIIKTFSLKPREKYKKEKNYFLPLNAN